MCGIAGIIAPRIRTEDLSAMLRAVSHRGPESDGQWFSRTGDAALGHRRLAIIDLSPLGHQPMVSSDGRYSITFNGEIYNYRDVRDELRHLGFSFVSESDTEVLLNAYIAWGVKCLQKINGMFAFAVWDDSEKRLFAARDPLGEKPFKYYASDDTLVFASEVKALLAHPAVPRAVDWQAVDIALSFRFVPAPRTGFTDIQKLPAGHYLVWQRGVLTIERYWHGLGGQPSRDISLDEWKKNAWSLFVDSVKKRMVSDVPVGAFLSGGIDSTSVVAAMAEVASQPINTYVVSWGGESDDARYARMAADYFQTNHHELQLKDLNYQELVEAVSLAYDEPFFDQSALPTLAISRAMKKEVTVVLSGDGGDELFGGYDAYRFVRTLEVYERLPQSVRQLLPKALAPVARHGAYQTEVMQGDFYRAYTEYYALWKTALPITRRYLTKEDLYTPQLERRVSRTAASTLMREWFGTTLGDAANAAMHADIVGRLADGYLTKVDIGAMQSAVEVRPPFLDPRLVAFAATIPSNVKIIGHDTKYFWKEVVKDHMPRAIITRPKMGFALPLKQMLRTELRPLIEDVLLASDALPNEYFSKGTIMKMWKDECADVADYSNHLWSLLMLSLWLKRYAK